MLRLLLMLCLFIFLLGCHQESFYISKFGQSIVLNPSQEEQNTKTISDQKLANITKPNLLNKVSKVKNLNDFKNIQFSSSKFLKGDRDCINIIRVKVLGSLSYDELMYELRKRATTMGGNAIGIFDLNENKEVIYSNQKILKTKSPEVELKLVKETNLISSVTADIFKCKSDI